MIAGSSNFTDQENFDNHETLSIHSVLFKTCEYQIRWGRKLTGRTNKNWWKNNLNRLWYLVRTDQIWQNRPKISYVLSTLQTFIKGRLMQIWKSPYMFVFI